MIHGMTEFHSLLGGTHQNSASLMELEMQWNT
jgi:hypothetical protein